MVNSYALLLVQEKQELERAYTVTRQSAAQANFIKTCDNVINMITTRPSLLHCSAPLPSTHSILMLKTELLNLMPTLEATAHGRLQDGLQNERPGDAPAPRESLSRAAKRPIILDDETTKSPAAKAGGSRRERKGGKKDDREKDDAPPKPKPVPPLKPKDLLPKDLLPSLPKEPLLPKELVGDAVGAVAAGVENAMRKLGFNSPSELTPLNAAQSLSNPLTKENDTLTAELTRVKAQLITEHDGRIAAETKVVVLEQTVKEHAALSTELNQLRVAAALADEREKRIKVLEDRVTELGRDKATWQAMLTVQMAMKTQDLKTAMDAFTHDTT
jgi:hypothetical protein